MVVTGLRPVPATTRATIPQRPGVRSTDAPLKKGCRGGTTADTTVPPLPTHDAGATDDVNRSRPQRIVARVLLAILGVDVAVGSDWLWPMHTVYLRIISIPLIGAVLWNLTPRDLRARPDTDAPTAVAGAVVIGFLARGAVDLIRLVLA